jgi:putative flippase GtrA
MMLGNVRRSLTSSDTARTFAGYLCIGVLGVSFYIALLWCFDQARIPSFVAFTLSYVIAVSAQFLLNRYLNFRAFDRAIHHQAGTYVVVTALNYVLMITVEELGIHVLRLNPIMAYILSIPVNLPIGYLANRYLTFGPGLLAFFRRNALRREHDAG